MDAAVTVGVIVKKVLSFLFSNEKGRRFLGYVIGIAVFVCIIPMIVLVGLFGWMSGGGNIDIENAAAAEIQEKYAERYAKHSEALERISEKFTVFGISDKTGLAQTIYISSDLPNANTDESFYTAYVNCFLDVSDEKSLTDIITEIFGIQFSEKDKQNINRQNGG